MKIGDLVKHKRGRGNSNIGVVLSTHSGCSYLRVYWFDYKIADEYHNGDLEEICK